MRSASAARTPAEPDSIRRDRGPGRSAASCGFFLSVPFAQPALQVHEQERDRGGSDARDPCRLPDRLGLEPIQLLLHLDRQTAHRSVVNVRWETRRLERGPALHVFILALDVALVLSLNFDLLRGDRIL